MNQVLLDRADVALLARSFNQVFVDGAQIVLRSNKAKEALILEKRTDSDTGEDFYSVTTIRPAEKNVWGILFGWGA